MSKRNNYIDLTYVPGVTHSVPAAQMGGAVIPAIIAADAALRSLKPFSRSKKALEDNIKNKSNPVYKVLHGITSVGNSIGWGEKPKKHKKKRKHSKK